MKRAELFRTMGWGALSLGLMAFSSTAFSEIVVVADRIPTAMDDVSSSVSVVSAADLERVQSVSLPEAIRTVPGVHTVRTGGPGQTATIYLRGAKPDHLLVLVDGIEMNDPSQIGRSADLSVLDLADIERVEVLRGSQSALYGADAMGGVINIITKRGEGPPTARLTAEGGSFSTYRGALSLSGSTGMVDYAFTVTRTETDGISAANEDDGNTERDGYDRSGFTGRIGISATETLSFDLIAKYSDSSTEYDGGAGVGGDVDGNVADVERRILGANGSLQLLDGQWQQKLSAWENDQRRDFTSSFGENWFDSVLTKVGWQHDLYTDDVNVFSVGVEAEKETAETDGLAQVSSEIRSVYVQDQIRLNGLTIVGGLRWDDHDSFGEEVTGRLGLNLKVVDDDAFGLRLKSTYGTGFKAPSLYQLYAPASVFGPIGNADLDAETSTSIDAGLELSLWDEQVLIGITGFYTEYEDLIDFVAGYVNESEADVSGVELTLRAQLRDDLRLKAAYTHLDSEDGDGERLSRRPRHRASAELQYDCCEDVTLSLSGIYVGERDDAYFSLVEFSSVSETLPSHTVVDLAASWDVSDTVTVFARVENLFDEDYEELAGYGTPGTSGYGGVRITL